MKEFHPDHLTDIRRSGLSNETILTAGIVTVMPSVINKCLGYSLPGLISMYEIPYGDGFSRYRCFYEEGKTGPKYPKYLQKKHSGNQLYIPPLAASILDDTTKPLCYTEGEKKALKSCQEGLPCIGLSGLWSWKTKGGGLIPNFDKIKLEGRAVYLIPDNDYRQPNKHGYKKNLKKAVNNLAVALIDRGARVFVVQLPDGLDKGLDDYLCGHTVEEFLALPSQEVRKLTLDEMIQGATIDDLEEVLQRISRLSSTIKQEAMTNLLVTKLKVSKAAIKKDLKRYATKKESGESGRDGGKMLALFPGLVDLVDDGGQVAFLIKDDAGLRIETSVELDGIQYIPPDKEYLPFLLPQADHCLFYSQGDDRALFDDLMNYFCRFSYLPNNHWLIIGLYVFQTYLQDHPDLHYMAMILFYAVPERGKSRTGKAAANIAFRGVHVVDMREANIFRYSGNLGATIFFDMMDLWKKAERNGCEDILLMRHEKGARASRVLYPEKGAFEDTVFYPIYGPTLMASNQSVHKILGSRCIPFTMPNAPGNYDNPTPELGLDLKARLTAWRARMMDKALPEVHPIKGISGRLWDITMPLLRICLAVCPERIDALTYAILELAGQRATDKQDTFDGLLVQALAAMAEGNADHYEIRTAELTAKFNELWHGEKVINEKTIGRRLKALGVHTDTKSGRSTIRITRQELDTLMEQHGFILHTPLKITQITQKSQKTIQI